jgi:hypothetical protein
MGKEKSLMSESTGGSIDKAREAVRSILSKYFRSDKRLDAATEDVVKSLSHMLTVHPVKKTPKGATVMTEGAATRKPDGGYTTRPSHI